MLRRYWGLRRPSRGLKMWWVKGGKGNGRKYKKIQSNEKVIRNVSKQQVKDNNQPLKNPKMLNI